jgi:hypothetical protein
MPHDLPAKLKSEGHKVGIVTNSKREYAEALIAGFNITCDELVAYKDTTEHKPHPAPLLLAMERLKSKPKNTFYIGDDEVDVQASYRAGITSIGAGWGARGWAQIGASPDILAYDTKIIVDEEYLWERPFIGDFFSPEVRWHNGSIIWYADSMGFSLGRYFVASDPRHGKSELCNAIINLKSEDRFAEDLGEILAKALYRSGVLQTWTFLVPVPPKPGDDRIRFETVINHAWGFLDQYSVCSPVLDGLKCVKDYGDLKKKSWIERQVAVRGAFKSSYDFNKKRVILIDDVSTSGATADECARVLLKSGAREVVKVTLGKDQQSFESRQCPRCGSELVIRHKDGESFWGCKAYSKTNCRFTESVR